MSCEINYAMCDSKLKHLKIYILIPPVTFVRGVMHEQRMAVSQTMELTPWSDYYSLAFP